MVANRLFDWLKMMGFDDRLLLFILTSSLPPINQWKRREKEKLSQVWIGITEKGTDRSMKVLIKRGREKRRRQFGNHLRGEEEGRKGTFSYMVIRLSRGRPRERTDHLV